jgi:transposase
MMSKKERRSYDKAFKMMAVELMQSGKTSVAVGEDLGIAPDLVRRWAREVNVNESNSFPGNGKQNLTDEQKQIVELKKALRDAETERDILKKAVSIFSKGDSKYWGL